MKSFVVLSFLCCVFATPSPSTRTTLLPSSSPTPALPALRILPKEIPSSKDNAWTVYCTEDGNVAVYMGAVELQKIECQPGTTCNMEFQSLGCRANNARSCEHNKLETSETNCAKYYKCVNGAKKEHSCPKKTCFDMDRSACMPGKCVNGKCVRGAYYSK